MQGIRRTGTILALVATLLIPAAARAQSPGVAPESGVAASLADVETNRGLIIRETVDRWRAQFRPFDPSQNTGGEEARLTATLLAAPAEKLLAASQAETYEEALAVFQGAWRGPSVIPVEGPIPNTLGSTANDLVFTPITPCRIIDTRIATDPALLGRIGPNTGKQFRVNLANFATQGGSATGCTGMPTTFDVSAVAINVASTDQTGLGNLAIIESGGGTPTAALLNYAPGVNLSNAAVVRSAVGSGLGDIYIRSNNSTSHVVVDLMGYFAAPVATGIETIKVQIETSCASGASCSLNATCPAGYGLTGGGGSVLAFTAGFDIIWDAPPYATSASWLCQADNNSGAARTFVCAAMCARVPGR